MRAMSQEEINVDLFNEVRRLKEEINRYKRVFAELQDTHEMFCEDDKQFQWTCGFGAAIDFIEDNLNREGESE